MKLCFSFLFAFAIAIGLAACWKIGSPASTTDAALRLNQIQTIGTHNSYRLAPASEVLNAIRLFSPEGADALDYSHRSLTFQLEELNVRQIELDIYADPEGGMFSKPIAYTSRLHAGVGEEPDPNENGGLDQPGLKILHSPDYDYRSTVPTFVAALTEIKTWSIANPTHLPILILVEAKADVTGPSAIRPLPFDQKRLLKIDGEIRAVFSADQMLSPDSVRGKHATLRESILEFGWPKLNECLGKVWFALDNEGSVRDRYLNDDGSLAGRLMFVSVDEKHPSAAFRKLNDPVSQFEEIQSAVRQGFIVRTRADAETREARKNDTRRRNAAFSSGAQYISTDYPIADERLSDYVVRLPEGVEFVTNPVSGQPR